MSGKTEWPQSLKDFANRVFSSCTDSNRMVVAEELRQVIRESFEAGTIQSKDWNNVQLKSLGGGSKTTPTVPLSKKGKKRSLLSGETDGFEADKKEKRAKRFERDQRAHEEDQERGIADAMGSTSLASRLGASGGSAVQAYGTNGWDGRQGDGAWTYDPTPSSAIASTSRLPPPPGFVGHGSPVPLDVPGGFDQSIADPNVIDWDRDTVVGLSTRLEKSYLRLTSAPDPKTVRPLPILQQTLELLKKKWRTEANYTYICDQFKSMRQDLTVQRIKNDFTVKVYEIHARIALEKGDLGEYNQCQSQLRTLYAYGLPGCQSEFLAYRILYLLHTRNRREVNALMSELTSASKSAPAVAHALAVRLSLATGNYHSFFKLYMDAPNMNAYIMDHFVERERVAALSIMARAYRPSLPLTHLSSELGFSAVAEAHEFLKNHSIAVYIDPSPAELPDTARAPAPSGSGRKKRHNHGAQPPPPPPPQLPLEQRRWDAKAALPGVIAAAEKYRKIDIKGQI